MLYYLIASKLPNYSFPGGKLYNWFRVYCLNKITIIGEGCRIMRKVYIGNGKDVVIGKSCRINENVRLDNVLIGNHVMIARDTVFLGKTHGSDDINIPMEQQGNKEMKQTIVEDDVWVGLRVIVMPSLVLKKGCIIGAGAVLTKNTNENGVYGGIPARLIKTREECQ